MARISLFTYPWDLLVPSIHDILSELEDLGVAGIDVASAYHAIEAFSPRRMSLFSSPRGEVHAPVAAERFSGIRPLARVEGSAGWHRLAEAIPGHRLKLNAWTVLTLQPWMAQDYPDTARVFSTGDPSDVAVCPLNEDVVEFFVTLVGELCKGFPLEEVRLEACGFIPFDYGMVRPRVLVPMDAFTRWNLGLCFCRSCTEQAVAVGIDVPALQSRTAGRVAAGLYAQHKRDPQWQASLLASDPELATFLNQKTDGVAQFVAELSRVAGEYGTGLSISYPTELSGAPTLSVDRAAGLVSSVLVRAGDAAAARAAAEYRALFQRNGSDVELRAFAPDWMMAAGPFDIRSPQGLRGLAEVGRSHIDEITLFHFGLLRPEDLSVLVRTASGNATST